VKIVSERLGHSSITITLDTYPYAIPGLQRDAPVVAALRECGGRRGAHPDHRKCRWLLEVPSVRYLWARSRFESGVYEVRRSGNEVSELLLADPSVLRLSTPVENWTGSAG